MIIGLSAAYPCFGFNKRLIFATCITFNIQLTRRKTPTYYLKSLIGIQELEEHEYMDFTIHKKCYVFK